MKPKGLVIFGFGGHARSLADVAIACGYKKLLFVDDQAKQGEKFLQFPVQRTFTGPWPKGWLAIPGISDNHVRKNQVAWMRAKRYPIATLISPRAILGVGSTIGPASFVAHLAYIGCMTKIGEGCIVNTASIVEHETVMLDYSHVTMRVGVAGRCKIGTNVFMGNGVLVIDKISIADNVFLGGGTVVIKDIVEPGVYVGNPARKIR